MSITERLEIMNKARLTALVLPLVLAHPLLQAQPATPPLAITHSLEAHRGALPQRLSEPAQKRLFPMTDYAASAPLINVDGAHRRLITSRSGNLEQSMVIHEPVNISRSPDRGVQYGISKGRSLQTPNDRPRVDAFQFKLHGDD